MVFVTAQSEWPASRQAGSFIGNVSTAATTATGSAYTRGPDMCTRVVYSLHEVCLEVYLWCVLNVKEHHHL